MTGTYGQRVNIEVAIAGVAALWLVTVGLMLWSQFGGPFHAGRWSLLLSAAAAAWTVVVGVRAVCCRLSQMIIESIEERVDERLAEHMPACALEVVRQIELRELESQVARLVPGSR